MHFFDWQMYAFVLLGLVFPYQAKRLAWGTPPILCGVRCKTFTESINESIIKWLDPNINISRQKQVMLKVMHHATTLLTLFGISGPYFPLL